MTEIALFEDNKQRRESLQLLIEQESDLVLVGSFDRATDAVEKIEKCMPDVVLMDIEMPLVSGVEATKQLKESFPGLLILMQTVHEDDDNLFESLRNGACGYILKKTSPDKIIEAIRDALNGGAPISPAMAQKMLGFFTNQKRILAVDYGISLRERQILKYLVEGYSYKMISDELELSYHTVNSHIKNVYDKLHVHSIGEAITKALREDLIN